MPPRKLTVSNGERPKVTNELLTYALLKQQDGTNTFTIGEFLRETGLIKYGKEVGEETRRKAEALVGGKFLEVAATPEGGKRYSVKSGSERQISAYLGRFGLGTYFAKYMADAIKEDAPEGPVNPMGVLGIQLMVDDKVAKELDDVRTGVKKVRVLPND